MAENSTLENSNHGSGPTSFRREDNASRPGTIRVKGGLWVTFAGGEGSGKTTQLDLLEQRLHDENVYIYRIARNNPVGRTRSALRYSAQGS